MGVVWFSGLGGLRRAPKARESRRQGECGTGRGYPLPAGVGSGEGAVPENF